MSEQKKNGPALYTAAGAPVANNQDSITAGARGPVLLEDVWLIEKLAHFDREVIPERGCLRRFRWQVVFWSICPKMSTSAFRKESKTRKNVPICAAASKPCCHKNLAMATSYAPVRKPLPTKSYRPILIT